MPKSALFGTSGIRGDAEKLFTNQFCFDLGRTFSLFLDRHKKTGPVAIGMDPRSSSPRILDAISSGVIKENRQVFNQGATPVPSINYILKANSKYVGSIMVSGSHIKPHLNGVKFFYQESEILKSDEREIEEIYQNLKEKISYQDLSSQMEAEDQAREDYQEMLLGYAYHKFPKWKIVVDAGDGAQSDVMPYVLKTLGFEVIEINTTIQGEFFSRDTEVENDFRQLQEKVMESKADFGVGYDSDGDRVVFIDEKGNFIPGDCTGTLVAREFPGDKVVTPINTSQVIDHIGKEVIRTKVGSPFVVETMKKNKVSFGFEANGGGIFESMLSRDGGRTTIEILNLLAKSDSTLSRLVAELPKYYLSRDKVEYRWELKEEIIKKAKEEFKGEKTEEMDGLKIWMDSETWILFRSSANAPEFRVFAESKDQEKSKALLKKGIALVNSIVNQ